MEGAWRLLRHRGFLALWLGLLVSSVGDWINFIAMVALVYQQTHSALVLAVLRLFHIVPILLLAPVAGVFVDRWNRRRTLILAPLLAGLSVGLLAAVHPMPLVFVSYGVITVALMFFNPALSASIPNIVDEDLLVQANALSEITSTTAVVIGGLAGGLVVATAGVRLAFAIDAVSFIVAAASILPLRIVETRAAGTARSVEHELLEGVRYLQAHGDVATVVLSNALFIFATASVFTLGVAFVQSVLHGGTTGYGIVVAGMGVGSVVGAAVMVIMRNRLRQDLSFVGSGTLLGLSIAALGLSRSVLAAAAAYGAAGLFEMVNAVSAATLIQRRVPDSVRGRIFAVNSTFDHAGAFASTMVIAALTGLLGIAGLITASGLLAAGAGLASLLLLERRRRT